MQTVQKNSLPIKISHTQSFSCHYGGRLVTKLTSTSDSLVLL